MLAAALTDRNVQFKYMVSTTVDLSTSSILTLLFLGVHKRSSLDQRRPRTSLYTPGQLFLRLPQRTKRGRKLSLMAGLVISD